MFFYIGKLIQKTFKRNWIIFESFLAYFDYTKKNKKTKKMFKKSNAENQSTEKAFDIYGGVEVCFFFCNKIFF